MTIETCRKGVGYMFLFNFKRTKNLVYLLIIQAGLLTSCANTEVDEYYREQMYKMTDAARSRAKNEQEQILEKSDAITPVKNETPALNKLNEDKKTDSKKTLHTMTKDETLWFLATVYYGNGSQYKKILSANHLTNVEVDPGTVLNIPNPKFKPSMLNFTARYKKLYKIRQLSLNSKKSSPKIASTKFGKKHARQLKSTSERSPAATEE